ncbi:hypothetical protein PR048_004383 [Dryococelus australis]|uniref:Uncharacterized protein n=1 Tax=Dryococelus australis TaxID=614101 RepID=A0ABQ9I598_9NEOP|nr:hypothetical protein PR048_004383 [Dryococelus australis]
MSQCIAVDAADSSFGSVEEDLRPHEPGRISFYTPRPSLPLLTQGIWRGGWQVRAQHLDPWHRKEQWDRHLTCGGIPRHTAVLAPDLLHGLSGSSGEIINYNWDVCPSPFTPLFLSSQLMISPSIPFPNSCPPGATVAERLAHSPPTKVNRVQSLAGGNYAGQCRWSVGFLGDLPFPPLLHIHFNVLIGSRDLAVKSRPNLFTPVLPANWVQSLARSPDFHKWESCWMMPLVGGFSRGSPVSPAPSFRHHSIFTAITLICFEDLNVELPKSLHPLTLKNHCMNCTGAMVAERLALLPPTKGNRVRSPDFCKWEWCRMMLLVGWFSRGSPVSPTPLFRRYSIFTSITLICSQDLSVKSSPNLFTFM